MTIYITQGRYTRDAISGMIENPEDRAEAVRALAEASGAKLIDVFITFGEYDFLVILESDKKDVDAMAALFVAASGGGVTDLKTTVGVRSSEAVQAMETAKKIRGVFRSAGQQ